MPHSQNPILVDGKSVAAGADEPGGSVNHQGGGVNMVVAGKYFTLFAYRVLLGNPHSTVILLGLPFQHPPSEGSYCRFWNHVIRLLNMLGPHAFCQTVAPCHTQVGRRNDFGGLQGELLLSRGGAGLSFLGAFCLDVRTLTFCQLMGFPLDH